MRFLQAILLVIGSTALGTCLGYLGLILTIASLQRPGGEPWQAGFGQHLGGLICGAPLGSLIGLALSLGWMSAREESRAWDLPVWLGVLVGLVLGPIASFRWNLHQAMGWWGTAVLTIASGAAGGLLAGILLKLAVRRARR